MCFITSYCHHPLRVYTLLHSIRIDLICNCLILPDSVVLCPPWLLQGYHSNHVHPCRARPGLYGLRSSWQAFKPNHHLLPRRCRCVVIWCHGRKSWKSSMHPLSQQGFFACGSSLPSKPQLSHHMVIENLIAVVFQRERVHNVHMKGGRVGKKSTEASDFRTGPGQRGNYWAALWRHMNEQPLQCSIFTTQITPCTPSSWLGVDRHVDATPQAGSGQGCEPTTFTWSCTPLDATPQMGWGEGVWQIKFAWSCARVWCYELK